MKTIKMALCWLWGALSASLLVVSIYGVYLTEAPTGRTSSWVGGIIFSSLGIAAAVLAVAFEIVENWGEGKR